MLRMCWTTEIFTLLFDIVFHVAQASLVLKAYLRITLTPDPPAFTFQVLNYRCVPPCPVYAVLEIKTTAPCMLHKGSTN